MMSRIKANIVVFLLLTNQKGEVYLQQRSNTGFMDGLYEPIAGHLEYGEYPVQAAAREASEEAGIIVNPEDIELFAVSFNHNQEAGPYLGLIFRTNKWKGKPETIEHDKCSDSGFFELENVQEKLIPQMKNIHETVFSDNSISILNFEQFNI